MTSPPEDLGPGDAVPDGDLAPEDLAPDGTLAPEDLAHDDVAPEDLARDGVASDPALDRSSERAPEEPDRDPLEQEYEHPKVAATGAGSTVTPAGVPETSAHPEVATADTTASAGPLLASEDAEAFRARWTDVQFGFVALPVFPWVVGGRVCLCLVSLVASAGRGCEEEGDGGSGPQ